MNNQEEIWKSIPGYENYYQVSNLGNVKSLSRLVSNRNGNYATKERCLKQLKHLKGYLMVFLSKNNKMKGMTIHRLVAMAFLGESNLQVDHINGIKSDNCLSNLRYVTNRENCIYYQLRKKNKF